MISSPVADHLVARQLPLASLFPDERTAKTAVAASGFADPSHADEAIRAGNRTSA